MIRSRIKSRRKKARPGRLRGPALKALRLACFERDGYRCRNCGVSVFWGESDADTPYWALRGTRRGHMAHIGAKRRHGDSLDNVRTLCGTCHGIEHQYGKSGVKPCPSKEHSA
jgi:5-methylcytosine-specific restriction endonuclease McrA